MGQKSYRIADLGMLIKGEFPLEDSMFPPGFGPFVNPKMDSLPLLTLETGIPTSLDGSFTNYSFQFEELNLACDFMRSEESFALQMRSNDKLIQKGKLRREPIILKMPRRSRIYATNLSPGTENMSEFSFLLWNAFGVASASKYSVAIHSSVIIHEKKAILFLGESGTGKSTHTQLWLKSIPNCKLLNDDSPVIRILDDQPICFGSPWSGKGKCYYNESFPIAGIVRLRQAPGNWIRRLKKMEAFAAIYPSCPPSFSIDSDLTDLLCQTISKIIENTPVYLLDCLPDVAAAELSFKTILGQ